MKSGILDVIESRIWKLTKSRILVLMKSGRVCPKLVSARE